MNLRRADLVEIRHFKRSKRAFDKKGSELKFLLLALVPLVALSGANLLLPPPATSINGIIYLCMSAVFLLSGFRTRCARAIVASVDARYEQDLKEDSIGYRHEGDYLFMLDQPEAFHNPDLEECWSDSTPLFNVNEWGHFIPPATNQWGDKYAYDTYPPAVDLKPLFLSGLPVSELIKIAFTNNADKIVSQRDIRFREINI